MTGRGSGLHTQAGLARIKQAVENKIAVGAVRFDFHPGLGFKSGDDLFR